MTQSNAVFRILFSLTLTCLSFSNFAFAQDDNDPDSVTNLWKKVELEKLNPRKVDFHVIERLHPVDNRKTLAFDRKTGTLWYSKGSDKIRPGTMSSQGYLVGVKNAGRGLDTEAMMSVANIAVDHNPEAIAIDPSGIIGILGRDGGDHNFSKISLIANKGDGYRVEQKLDLPQYYWFTHFALNTQGMYFSVPGMPGQKTIIGGKIGSEDLINAEVVAPGAMKLEGNKLFVIERNNLNVENDDNFAVINIDTGATKRLASKPTDYLRHRLLGVEYLPAANKVAVSESLQDNVLIVNPETAALEQTIKIPTGKPNAMATLGRCLVVASEYGATDKDTPYIYFYDITQSPVKLVEAWDTSSVGTDLRTIRALAVNPANGAVFARSSMLPGAKFFPNAVVALYDRAQTARNYCYNF